MDRSRTNKPMKWPTPQHPTDDLLSPKFIFQWVSRFYHAFLRNDANYEYFTLVDSASVTAYTVLENDTIILIDCTTANVTVTLPAQTDLNYSKKYIIKKTDSSSNTITLATADSATFKGENVLYWQYDALTVISDGTDWQVFEYNYTEITAFTPELFDDTLAIDPTPPTYVKQHGHAVRTKHMIFVSIHIKISSLGSLTTTENIRVGN